MNFKQFLQINKKSRKIFGRKELEIILKQLDGKPLTQSEKNRLSRDIRPKFEFFNECTLFTKFFKLKKGELIKEQIESTLNKILTDSLAPHIQLILLFGSAVDFSMSYRSDIDICVVFDKSITPKQATEFRLHMLSLLPSNIDVQIFELLPFKIRREILKKSKILYKAEHFDSILFSLRWFKIINTFKQEMQAIT